MRRQGWTTALDGGAGVVPFSAATDVRPPPKGGNRGTGLVRFENVGMRYGTGSEVLRDINFMLEPGSFHFLTGPSGAGKSSLLKLLYLAHKPSRGLITLFERDIATTPRGALPALRRRIGVVFQDFKLLKRLTIEENVAIPLEVVGTPRREVKARVFRVLKQVGLQHRRYHHPLSLSGGEQQRVALARALVNEPEILLADEPTGNLDPELTIEIMDLIARASTRGTTVIVATHDLSLIERYGKRTIRLEQGRIADDVPSGRGGL